MRKIRQFLMTMAESPQSGRRALSGLFKSKAMKCLLTFVFATLIVGQTWAQTYVVNGTTQYTVIDETNHYVSIFEGNRNKSGAITIDERVYLNGAYYQVTAIANEGFKDCANITSITIPNTITSIGYDAFSGCSSLDKAVFSSIESFFGISYGNDLSNPLYYAKHFYTGGTEVINLVIPESVTSIADYAFYKCSSLVSVSIPESVTSIGKYAFSGCKGLTEVTVPNSVTRIGISAFGGCSGLTKITLPFVGNRPHAPTDNYQYPFGYIFGESSYTGGTKTEQNYYGSSTSSTTGAHYYIPTSLKEVVITGSSYIPYAAFENCWNLTSVTIPNSVTSIGGFAFYRCGSLAEITIPESVTSIGNAAFNNCISLTGITIPNSVTSIGNSAFYNCSGLTSVAISNSVTMIGTNTFYGCWSLREVTIPNSVTSIGSSAFYGCSNLTSIVIPQNITRVWDDAFANCTRLTSVTVNSETVDLSNSGLCFTKDGIRYAVLNKYNVMVAANSCANNVTIATSVTSGNSFSITGIAADAFKDCTTLSTINIPANVTSVGANAFSGCTGLTSIIITSNADFSKSGLQFTKDDNKYLVLNKSVARIITTPGNGTMPATVTFGNEFTVTGIVPTEPNMVGDVYQIATAGNLYWFARNVNSGGWDIKGILTADIVVNENVLNENGTLNGDGSLFMPWTPIGTSASKFKGSFDGNYHTISGLYFNNTTNNSYSSGGGNYVGLIGYANGATIKNVGVIDSYIRGNTYVGGICGIGGTQTNCYNTGTVSGSGNTLSEGRYVGGICGSGGTQTNCFNTGKVSGGNYVGGICGNGSSQTQCYYLASCGSKNTYGVSATENEFASGKIAYLLNGSTSQGTLTWYQTIGEDKLPLFDNTHRVVYASTPCPYSNNSNGILEHNHIINGLCICGDAEQPNSVDGVYQIANAGHLYWFAAHVNSGNTTDNAVLTADIVVNSNVLNSSGSLNGDGSSFMTWTPIGTSSYIYAGTFDGNGHTISGLYFNNTTNSNYPDGENYVGLIGYANGATIKDVGVTGSYLYGYKFTGGICGYGYNTNITNCYNTGRVSGSNNYVGGISGCRGTITNCYNTGTVSGTSSNSYYVGGICGGNGTQTNCYNTGTVSSSGNCVGGICGDQGTQNKCHNAGKVSGSNNYVGGICGNQGSQTNCYNIETVSGKSYVGGICGYQGTQTNCYDTGTVSGSSYYGCICGGRGGTQTNCYSLVTLSSSNGTDGAYYSENAFASGQVAYKLNDSDFNGTTWRQTLYSDATPVFDESHNAVTGYTLQSYNVITVTGDLVVATNYEVAEGKTLKIPAGASVTTTDDAVITNNGTIICNGTIAGNDLVGNGSFVYDQIAENDITLSAESVPYKGSAYTIGNGIEVSYTNRTMCDKTFIFGGSIAEPTYENNITPGTATIHWGNTVSKQFTILPLTVSSPTITLSQTSFTYNGSAIEPTVTVKNGETTIDPSEYTVSYSNNTNAGTTATVTITDKEGGNYTVSSVSATFTINPKVVSSPTIELSATSFTYNGSAQTPTVTVKDGETTIASGEYTVSYSSNTNAGTATVTIADKANGNYTVSGSATFTISPKEVSSPTIALSQTSYTYDGSAKTPTVSSVKDGSTTIASGEYTVSYSNNTNAGTATVTIADKANGNYTVSGSATFTISPKEVSSPTIEFSDAEITYTGSALTPTITVKDGSTVIPTSEYTVGYSNNTNAGTANLTITDKANGNYTVSGETTFTINPKTVSNPTITLSQTTFIYDGTAKSPTVTSVKDGSTVIPASEYTVTMPDDAVSVGDYTVEIEDIDGGNYTVSGTATYVINLCTEHQFDDFGQCTICGEYVAPEEIDGVYQIASAANLYWFADWVKQDNATANAVLIADIVVNSNVLAADGTLNGDGSNFRTWTPIGIYDEDEEYFFSGTFDGDNHTISGLYLADWGNNAGLFGFAEGATIKNVGIVDSYFSGVGDIGSICGFAYDNSTITNCYNTGTVSCEEYEVGGICGYLENSTITNCHNTGTINSGEGCTGGICGYAYGNNTISNCYNTGSVTSKYGAGGICGVVSDNSAITNCHNEGTVSCEVYDAGGICGDAYENITITNCYNTGTINSGEECAGGICGYFEGECTITNCFNTGTVTGPYFVGGVCCVFTDELELSNNFYLAGCATVGEGENAVVQNGVGVWQGEDPATDVEGVTAATASEFAGGHIAYLLNNSEQGSGVWYQTLFADASPVLDAEHNSPTGYITEEGSVVTVVGSVVVESAYEVANGKTLNIPAGASLTTTGDGVITNNGTIVLNGTLAGNDLAGSGNFIYGGQIATADLVLSNANYVYKGSAYDDIEFTVSRTICGKVFTYGDAYTVSYANNINAGQATISLTNNNDAENVVSSQFTIKPIEDEVVVTITLADKSVVFSGAAQTYNSEDALTIEANNALYNISWVSASGNAASVSGTNAAEYAFGWNAEMFSNTSTNFTNVRFDVTDGKLIITPNTEVVVTVTENSSTLTYNGEEQSVSGYSVAISDATGVYTEDDFAFSGTATASGINAGVYPMQLSADDFSNTNKNFAEVTFNIVDGALTINRAAEAPNKPEANIETRFIVTQLVELPDDWKWADEQQALEEGDNTATANYTGADKGNYEVESVDITITRLECLHNEGNTTLYTLEPTCTHKGYTGNTSCKLCGQIYEMGDSIPALGHDFVETVVAPTCTADGYTEHLCSRCQHIEYSDTVAATGHKADSVVFENVVAATCTTAGSRDSVVYCSVCQIELSRIKVVIPAGHHIVVDPAVAATCTATGLTEGSHCDVCHEVLVAQTTTTAAGHAAGAAVAENLKAATCTAAGSVDSVVYCTVCKAELSRKTVEIPVASHTAGAAVAENLKAATCTAAGSVDSVVYCTVCKAEISRKTVELPVIAHTEVVDVAVAATCTESGLTEGSHCPVCNTIIKAQEVIPAKGHKADSIVIENVVAATYKAAGSYDSVVYCSVCKVELSRTKVVVPQLVAPKIDAEVVVSQISYTVGDSLKLDGGKIVIATSDSTTAEVVITPEMVSGFNPDSIGVQTVMVSFEIDGVAYTTTFDVEVKDIAKPIDAEVVISQINYTVGDSLNLEGGKLIFATSDSTTAEVVITPEMISGFKPDSVGVQTVTVSFEIDGVPYTTTFDVEVKEAEVIEIVAKSIAVSAKPAKVEYKQGEALDVTGGKITVTYSDNTTAEIELKADMVSGFDADKVGAQQLTITLKIDKVVLTATFDVTVEANDNTAISDDEAAAVNIYAYQNVIVVESADALEGEISIFDVNGRMVAKEQAAGSRTEIIMQNQGFYIVKVNNTAKRVMVY